MRKNIKKIILSLSAAAISTSCSLALVNNENEALEGDHKIVISGAVSELGTNNPLQGIKVTLQALPANVLYPLPILTLSEYTDNNGTYSISAGGFSDVITCKVTAASADPETMSYAPASQEHHISWSGPSFDEEKLTFFVNDCNFQLAKTDAQ